MVDVLLSRGRCGDLEARDDEYGRTALWLASWKGHASVVERLLCAGAEAEDKTGRQPLVAAPAEGHEAAAALLEQVVSVGGHACRAKRIWSRRRGATLWRVAVNYDQLG